MDFVTQKTLQYLRQGKTGLFFRGSSKVQEIYERSAGWLGLPSGRLAAGSPLSPRPLGALDRELRPGLYPVFVYIHHQPDAGDQVAFAEIRFSHEQPVRFAPARLRSGTKTASQFFTVSGIGGFFSAESAGQLDGMEQMPQRLEALGLAPDAEDTEIGASPLPDFFPFHCCPADPAGGPGLDAILFSCPPGAHRFYWGLDAAGEVCCLIADCKAFRFEPANRIGQGALFLVLAPFLSLFPALLLFFLTWEAHDLFLRDAAAPLLLLQRLQLWYLALLGSCALALLLVAAVTAAVLRRFTRSDRAPFWLMPQSARLGAAALCIAALFSIGMPLSEQLPTRLAQVRADIVQAESGELCEVMLWLNGNTVRGVLPGPNVTNSQAPVTRYSGIGTATDHKWLRFYVPDGLGFAPAAADLYRESQSILWNQQHAQLYQLRFTLNYHVVFSIEEADLTRTL